ncbi:hypothetical protein ACINK0_17675 (plasmid) [Deinococcus sp. VB343]|uniref:Uncharacterized protein n=1 Tax=Deinococcus sp. VB142 TaxID=3112952 RepID=A0AAU6Q7U1_9DEIO
MDHTTEAALKLYELFKAGKATKRQTLDCLKLLADTRPRPRQLEEGEEGEDEGDL